MANISQEKLDALLKGHKDGTLKKGSKNDRLGRGAFLVEGVELKKISEKREMQTADGQTVEIEVINAYVIVLKVIESNCTRNPVGSLADQYIRQNGAIEWQRDADNAELISSIATLMTVDGAAPEASDISGVLKDGSQLAGFRAKVQTNPKKGKEGEPANADPFMYHNYAPAAQTLAEVMARKTEIAAKAAALKGSKTA